MGARVVDLELSALPGEVPLAPHIDAFALIRVHGRPVGTLRLRQDDQVLPRERVVSAVRADHGIARRAAEAALAERLAPGSSVPPAPTASWTVAVCTRDRPELLRRCLKSIQQLDPAPPQVVVVDNAPSGSATRQVVAAFEGVDYVLEPVPGLNRARRRATDTAAGEVVLFTDDDVVVDPLWARGLLEPFSIPRVGVTTGLTMPLELETDAQEYFEWRGGFGRGFVRREIDFMREAPANAGAYGAGASMAFRRDVIDEIGAFDVDLDCGTRSRTGGDTYALYLALRGGYRLVYNPDALAWHQHRSNMTALKQTLGGYGTGHVTWLLRAAVHHRDLGAAGVLYRSMRWHYLADVVAALKRREGAPPLEMALAELRGALAGPAALLATRALAR